MREALFERLIDAYVQSVRIMDPIRFGFYNERGLTMPQARALFILAEKNELPAGDLAELLSVSPSTLSGMTDRLFKQGLIVRKENPRDRRVVLLALSDEGARLTTEVFESSRAHLHRVFETMQEDRLEALATALEDFAAADASLRANEEAVPSPA